MRIKNIKIYTPEQTFVPGEMRITGAWISEIAYEDTLEPVIGEECIDGEGAYAMPGFLDMHFHGCMGADFCDGTEEAVRTIAQYEESIGVTAIAPATMTLSDEELASSSSDNVIVAGAIAVTPMDSSYCAIVRTASSVPSQKSAPMHP